MPDDSRVWKPPGGLREDSFRATVVVLFITLTKGFIRKDVKSASISSIKMSIMLMLYHVIKLIFVSSVALITLLYSVVIIN